MKRGTVLFLLSIVTGFYCSCNNDRIIEKEVFDKIDIGMTRPEIKRMLGEPFDIRLGADSLENYFYHLRHKKGDVRTAQVSFDKSGYVRFFSAGLAS